jgi:acyl-CoA reductase-like NAD-dependent aldehyde dehydrogenase
MSEPARPRAHAVRPACGAVPPAGAAAAASGAAPASAAAAPAPAPGAAPASAQGAAAPAPRVAVRKTYKLYIGGAFPRSESGRSYPVADHRGGFLANAALASRKDARDAVVAARKAFGGWSAATAYNRGQVLYRVAELLEGRRAQFAAEVRAAEGLGQRQAEAAVDAAVDRWVWYAGWADKIAQVRGAANPVAGPYFNFSLPEPAGVVAVIAPQASSLLGFVCVVAPAVVTGNTVVALASERRPLPAVTLSEVLATSDVPGGVVNVLTGRTAEIAPWLASHMDVNAIDVSGAPAPLADELAVAAAENLKRVVRLRGEDWTAAPGLDRMLAYLETKTVWHPAGT